MIYSTLCRLFFLTQPAGEFFLLVCRSCRISCQKFSTDNAALHIRRRLLLAGPSNPRGGCRTDGIDSGRRYEGCYIMFCESLFRNVLLEEQRSCQSATGLRDRQFTLKENGGLQSAWQLQTGGGRKPDSPWMLHRSPTDRSMRWYMKPMYVFYEVLEWYGSERIPRLDLLDVTLFQPVRSAARSRSVEREYNFCKTASLNACRARPASPLPLRPSQTDRSSHGGNSLTSVASIYTDKNKNTTAKWNSAVNSHFISVILFP